MTDNTIAADEARRVAQHEAMKSRVERDVNADIQHRAGTGGAGEAEKIAAGGGPPARRRDRRGDRQGPRSLGRAKSRARLGRDRLRLLPDLRPAGGPPRPRHGRRALGQRVRPADPGRHGSAVRDVSRDRSKSLARGWLHARRCRSSSRWSRMRCCTWRSTACSARSRTGRPRSEETHHGRRREAPATPHLSGRPRRRGGDGRVGAGHQHRRPALADTNRHWPAVAGRRRRATRAALAITARA